MIVAKTKCCDCGIEIELDDVYGWSEDDENVGGIICDKCEEVLLNERR